MFVNIDRQFQQIYTNESKAKKKEIYEIIYTEEFKKLQAYKDNINSIYDEMIEMVHEIKNQKKAIYSYTKKLEKMKNDMLDSIQVFNEWLIKLQKKEEEKKTIKKNYSFGKEED